MHWTSVFEIAEVSQSLKDLRDDCSPDNEKLQAYDGHQNLQISMKIFLTNFNDLNM